MVKNRDWLHQQIVQKQSFLCVGLDSDITRLPDCVRGEDRPVLRFNQKIIEATQQYCVAYKINTAFYESRGVDGWRDLYDTVAMIPNNHLIIADAKRGDIGNTSLQYAKSIFDDLGSDAITVSPYMGSDSISPFLTYQDKWTIILALTSNKGGGDFQLLETDGKKLYESVLDTTKQWGSEDQIMYVVGATKPEYLKDIRTIIPNHFLLVPGVGAQGGSLEDVYRNGTNDQVGLLINSSRGIIFASNQSDYAEAAGLKAKALQEQMATLMV